MYQKLNVNEGWRGGYPLNPFPPTAATPQGVLALIGDRIVSDDSAEKLADDERKAERLKSVRDRIMTIRVTEDDYQRYSNAAKWMHLSLSDFFRNALDSGTLTHRSAPKPRKKRPEKVRHVDPELLTAINKIGNNLNQIGKGIQQVRWIGEEISLSAVLLELVKIEHDLAEIIKHSELDLAMFVEQIKQETKALITQELQEEEGNNIDDD